jgi:hypothetical protein
MSQGGGVQSDPFPTTELGVGEGILLQYYTEQKFEAKLRYVYSSVVCLTDIWALMIYSKSCSIFM